MTDEPKIEVLGRGTFAPKRITDGSEKSIGERHYRLSSATRSAGVTDRPRVVLTPY